MMAILAPWHSEAGRESLTGKWSLDSIASDQIDQAIEECIAGDPEVAKLSRRDRLQETNKLVHTLFITSPGNGQVVLIGYETAEDGSQVPTIDSEGESFQHSVILEGEALVESFQPTMGDAPTPIPSRQTQIRSSWTFRWSVPSCQRPLR